MRQFSDFYRKQSISRLVKYVPPRPFGTPSHGQGLSAHMPLEFSTLNRVRVGVPPMSFAEPAAILCPG